MNYELGSMWKRLWPVLGDVTTVNGESEENHEKPYQSSQPELRTKPSIFQIQRRSPNH